MKHQQVSVDYWAMAKSMITYGALTALVWLMLRLVGAAFSLPRRLRAQQENMQATIKELQRRYPDLNITEEDLKDAEKEFEELMKEEKEKENSEIKDKNQNAAIDDKPDEKELSSESATEAKKAK